MNAARNFPADYAAARSRFREGAARLGWTYEQHAIDAVGPAGEALTTNVACSATGDPERVLVVSSGIHGVEGFFGSAVQAALFDQWAAHFEPPVKCVFLHALNPFGFAWLRRFDENNVDLNRNFLLPEEPYEGSPRGYPILQRWLNPQRPPSRWNSLLIKAPWIAARHGIAAIRQAVAAGQYEYPQGIFFGGAGPTQTHCLLRDNLPRWLGEAQHVVHLDFHTGLGPFASGKLLIDYPLDESQRARLTEWFGAGSFIAPECGTFAYHARGEWGRWCVSHDFAPDYLYACAEFGTYGPLQMLAGLRAENQAHHWADPSAAVTAAAKRRLKELFCPRAASWRSRVLDHALDMVRRAIEGLTRLS